MYLLLITLIIIVLFKWIIILLLLPFQFLYSTYRKTNKLFYRILSVPCVVVDRITQGGYDRWMIIQVGQIPSCNLRRIIYKVIGCKMGKNNVFHYGAEIRAIRNLKLGGAIL